MCNGIHNLQADKRSVLFVNKKCLNFFEMKIKKSRGNSSALKLFYYGI